MLPEDELVDLIARAAGSSREVLVGIGDDAAVLAGGLVASTDILVDGVHFDSSRMDARSDMAAMGARPLCLLAAVGLPGEFAGVGELAEGLASHGVPVAGGDLSRAPLLVVSVTALGRAERPVLRSGGRPGDLLVVSGPLGGQAAAGYTLPITPRLAEGAALARFATAMIDISDGIATDARRLADASGAGALVRLGDLPRAAGATVEQAAAGGEDYELLAAVPPGASLPGWATVIGRLREQPGLVLVDPTGAHRPDLVGYDHFA
jgi:thiamine-monophosphate kinase